MKAFLSYLPTQIVTIMSLLVANEFALDGPLSAAHSGTLWQSATRTHSGPMRWAPWRASKLGLCRHQQFDLIGPKGTSPYWLNFCGPLLHHL